MFRRARRNIGLTPERHIKAVNENRTAEPPRPISGEKGYRIPRQYAQHVRDHSADSQETKRTSPKRLPNAEPSPVERRFLEVPPPAWQRAQESGVMAPPRDPSAITDPTTLRANEVPDFDPAARILSALGEDFGERVRATLHRGQPGEVLTALTALERAARDARKALEAAERMRPQMTAEEAEAAENMRQRAEQEARQRQAEAERQAERERVAERDRLDDLARRIGLRVTERFTWSDSGERQRVYRVHAGDRPQLVSARRFESSDLAAVDRWLTAEGERVERERFMNELYAAHRAAKTEGGGA